MRTGDCFMHLEGGKGQDVPGVYSTILTDISGALSTYFGQDLLALWDESNILKNHDLGL